MSLRSPTFEDMVPGTELGPVVVRVDEDYVHQNVFATENYSLLGSGGRVGSPISAAILLGDMLRLLNNVYDPNEEAGLHQRERVKLIRPLDLDDTISLNARIVDRYVKRGKGYVVTRGEAVSTSSGAIVLEHVAIEVAELNTRFHEDTQPSVHLDWPARRIDPDFGDDGARIDELDAATPAGSLLGQEARSFSQAQLSVYSNVGAFWETIHTSLGAAKRAGLESTYAQGLMLTEFACDYTARWLGPAWYAGGVHETTYLRPFGAGTIVSVDGRVESVSETAATLHLRFLADDADVIAVGYSSGPITPR